MEFCLIGQNNVWKGLARGLWAYQNAMHSGKGQGKNIFSDLCLAEAGGTILRDSSCHTVPAWLGKDCRSA